MLHRPIEAAVISSHSRAHQPNGCFWKYSGRLVLVLRAGMILLEIALADFVVVTSALVQAIVDSCPVDKKRHCPRSKQKNGDAKEPPEYQHQSVLPGRWIAYLVPLAHLFDMTDKPLWIKRSGLIPSSFLESKRGSAPVSCGT